MVEDIPYQEASRFWQKSKEINFIIYKQWENPARLANQEVCRFWQQIKEIKNSLKFTIYRTSTLTSA